MSLSLGLSLNFSQRQEQKCILCAGTLSEHQKGCVIGRIQELVNSQHSWYCPDCHAQKVELNKEDFYECARCHAQFTTGMIVPGEEPPHKEFWLSDGFNYIPVYRLREKGKGRLKFGIALKELEKEKKRLLRAKRK